MLRSFSSSSIENARSRTRSSSARSAVAVTSVFSVRRASLPRPSRLAASSGAIAASSALPIAVQCSGIRIPTREAVW